MWKWLFSSRAITPQLFGAADVGARSEQQDYYYCQKIAEKQAWLMILADGMGGHEGGALASRIAVEAFAKIFLSELKSGSPVRECFERSLGAANEAISQYQLEKPQFDGMGTTLVAAYISEAQLTWISVGDSPMWLFRNRQLSRLNEDHSLREIVGEFGKNANMLRSALTGQPIPLVDRQLDPMLLRGNDALLLASDGLLTLDEKVIESTVGALGSSASAIANDLIKKIIKVQRPNQDNCTVIVGVGLSRVRSSAVGVSFGKIAKRLSLLLAIMVVAMAILIWWIAIRTGFH